MQQTEAGGDILSDFVYSTLTPSSALINTNSPDILVCVLYLCETTFSLGDISFFLVFKFFVS